MACRRWCRTESVSQVDDQPLTEEGCNNARLMPFIAGSEHNKACPDGQFAARFAAGSRAVQLGWGKVMKLISGLIILGSHSAGRLCQRSGLDLRTAGGEASPVLPRQTDEKAARHRSRATGQRTVLNTPRCQDRPRHSPRRSLAKADSQLSWQSQVPSVTERAQRISPVCGSHFHLAQAYAACSVTEQNGCAQGLVTGGQRRLQRQAGCCWRISAGPAVTWRADQAEARASAL